LTQGGGEAFEATRQLLGGLLFGERVVPRLEVPQHRLERRRDAVLGLVVVGLRSRRGQGSDAARAARKKEKGEPEPRDGEPQRLTTLTHSQKMRGAARRPPSG